MKKTSFLSQEKRSIWKKISASFLMLSVNLTLSGLGTILLTMNVSGSCKC